MKNEKRIKKILDDLYKIDPEFKKHEKKISKIISELLLLQADIKPDNKFADDLRAMLKIEAKKNTKKATSKVNNTKKANKETSKNYFLSTNFIIDLSRSFVIVAILLLFVVGLSFSKIQTRNLKISKDNLQSEYFKSLSETKIVKLGKNSFGSLSFENQEGGLESDGRMISSQDQYALGFGSSSNVGESFDVSVSDKFIDDVYIMPIMTKYNYIYNGGDFDMFNSEEEVYKRIVPSLSGEIVNQFSNNNFSIIDLNKFKNLNVSNFSFLEDRDFGYNIHFGLEEGNFSIYKNWKKWPRIETICGSWDNYQCFENHRLSFSDVPQNSELIQIANNFLRDYGINLDNYGNPQVQNYWLRDYSLASDKPNYYIPDSINIIYPLVINDKQVYEEYGNISGLNVEVDIRERKVAGLHGLSYQQYQSSTYDTETDISKILDLAYKGGNYYDYDYDYYGDNYEYEVIDIELGTPSLELVKIWNYDNITMTSQELYIPAYVFPIISESDSSNLYKQNVVIPAVKEFFDRYKNINSGGEARVLPYIQDIEEILE